MDEIPKYVSFRSALAWEKLVKAVERIERERVYDEEGECHECCSRGGWFDNEFPMTNKEKAVWIPCQLCKGKS